MLLFRSFVQFDVEPLIACMMLLFRSFVQFDVEPLIACMMLLFRSFVQFDVEPLIAYCNSLNSLEQLPVYFYLITRIIQFDCLDRSLYSQGKMCDKTWLKIWKAFSLF